MIQALVPVLDFNIDSLHQIGEFSISEDEFLSCDYHDFYGGMLAIEIIDYQGSNAIVSKNCERNRKETTLIWEVPLSSIQFIEFKS